MPVNAGEIKVKLASLMGGEVTIPNLSRYIENTLTAGDILSAAADFMKKLGVLEEFMETLNVFVREFFEALFKSRPEHLGGNLFD